MLIFNDRKFVKSSFSSEAELEKVVIDNYEHLFGPDSFFLPKTKIKTSDGSGTIPDGFAIDIAQKKWYIVEAELEHHGVWEHIAKQVSKQIVASLQTQTRKQLVDISMALYKSDETLKEKFNSLEISPEDTYKTIAEILESDPVIGIPIDGIPNDLNDWARQQKFKVKLWIINKFIEYNNTGNIIYELPEEFKPSLDTEEEDKILVSNASMTKYDIYIIDLINSNIIKPHDKLFMKYKPKNGPPKVYEATVLEDGSISFLNKIFTSPSYAAVAGIQDAGSTRQTANGWNSWKDINGKTLAELREHLQQKGPIQL
ncbi:restriction system modified-DNA reader domain-containing protein [Hymenobacter fodinae]|uniref:RAMA domain-containing protein n=1 Tax=Hymenobacter fodinae TaxID=2510796 RepID=A0A4Z0P5I6_9BACT|nr:DUF4357 domain-containing protein [Hymenobacter fodinae]TGE06551.1 hypothetical protein EU556_17105 [Hymenobacter fodinae]